MPRKKNYLASHEGSAIGEKALGIGDFGVSALRRQSAHISFDSIPGLRVPADRSIDLSEWLSRGIDPWVDACMEILHLYLISGTRETSTLTTYVGGIRRFFKFLIEGRSEPLVSNPADLKRVHIMQFVGWLREEEQTHNWSKTTTRMIFHNSKSLLTAMIRRGIIVGDAKDIFPVNQFPGAASEVRSYAPYSEAEQQRLANALRADLVDIFHGRIQLTPSAVLASRYLIIAMRCGGNTTPLLEMRRDALQPGLLPGTKRLQTYKYRGHNTISKMLRGSEKREDTGVVPMDAVAVLEKTIQETRPLVEFAPNSIKDRVWLYRSAKPCDKGAVKCLTKGLLRLCIVDLVKRRNILSDSGTLLQVNTARLRQSLAKRAWRLSEGNPIAVASVIGNSPSVADLNYLSIDDQLKGEAAIFIKTELNTYLRSANPPPNAQKNSGTSIKKNRTISLTPTPTARCQDTLQGHRAPKDGVNHCQLFVTCFSCPSFAIVGEVNDLWRLFSYKEFAKIELHRLQNANSTQDSTRLRSMYQQAITFIEEFSIEKFGKSIIAQASKKVKLGLHPFWDIQIKKTQQRNGFD